MTIVEYFELNYIVELFFFTLKKGKEDFIIFKVSKIKEKQNFESNRKRDSSYVRELPLDNLLTSQQKFYRPGISGMIHSKC
jgi:hypothetical protein